MTGTLTSAPTTSLAICDGPTRYNLLMALTNRHIQTFELEGRTRVVRRIDAVRVFNPEVETSSQFVVTVFDQENQASEVWFYDSNERAGSTLFVEST